MTHGDNINEEKMYYMKKLKKKVKERTQTCVFMLTKTVDKVLLHINKDQKRIWGDTKERVQSALFLGGVAYIHNGFLIFFWTWLTCQILPNVFIESIRVTLVSKIMYVSSVQFYDTWCVYHSKSNLLCNHVFDSLYPLLPTPTPFLSGNHHAVVPVCEFLFISRLFICCFSVLYPTNEWNHRVLDMSDFS